MEEVKQEIFDMRDGSLERLDVSRGEDLTELYVQNNRLKELDLSKNKKLRKLDCTGNPLTYINACAPGCDGMFYLQLEAGNGGYVGLKFDDEEDLQEYSATAQEGYEFDGWYNELGDRISREPIKRAAYGACEAIIAAFRKK